MTEIQQLDKKVFGHIDPIKLPVLVLAIKHQEDFFREYNFVEGREFINIFHQTAGHANNDNYMTGIILKLKLETYEVINQINNSWRGSNCGMFGTSLEDVLIYRNQLKKLLGADCNESYKDFEEGIYPIDCSAENVRKLALDKIPDDLDDLIKFETGFEGVVGCVNRWNIYILGQNRN